jgi:hypothetical protein
MAHHDALEAFPPGHTATCQAVKLAAISTRPCKRCGTVIHFLQLRTDKLHPFDGDGKSHYATCPHAADFRKPPTQTQLFDTSQPPD